MDAILPNNPVYLQHTSGHMGVANSMALIKMNITNATTNPEGGNIDRFPNSNEPSGLIQETAMYPFVGNMLEILSKNKQSILIKHKIIMQKMELLLRKME